MGHSACGGVGLLHSPVISSEVPPAPWATLFFLVKGPHMHVKSCVGEKAGVPESRTVGVSGRMRRKAAAADVAQVDHEHITLFHI